MSYVRDSEIKDIIKAALAEDIGKSDITNKFLLPQEKKIRAVILAGEKGYVCGLDIARLVFKLQDNKLKFNPLVKDGDQIKKGQILVEIYGKCKSIISSERVALNFLGLLSGISTRTAEFVHKVGSHKVKIMDTRKTIPGLRRLQKYAVRIGGGYNHRLRLDEMVIIKDNHFLASSVARGASHITGLIETIKAKKPKKVKLEVEVRNLKEFRQALKARPDIIMLDNMKISDIKKAVAIKRKKPRAMRNTLLEASGNINLKNIRAYAQTGVEAISLGTLTKDVRCLDLSLEITKGGRR